MSPEKTHKQIADYIIRFTETYRQFKNKDIAERESACLRVQYPFILGNLLPDDLLAGRIKHPPVGFSPQMGLGFGYYLKPEEFESLLQSPNLDHDIQQKLTGLYEFWTTENTAYKTRQAYPQDMEKILNSDNWGGESGIGFPLYRMSGAQPDYSSLVRLGIPGLVGKIEKYRQKNDQQSAALYSAMLAALDLLVEVCLWYAQQAQENGNIGLARDLEAITQQPPQTLRQGIQLVWLYALLSGSVNYGRVDSYLADLYQTDKRDNALTSENALRLLIAWWDRMNEREEGVWIFDSRVIIGGRGRQNEESADELGLLCMEATRQTRRVIPQLTLRFYEGQNPQLYKKALDIIGENNPYPMLYNDDVNIPSVQHAFEIPRTDATDYLPFGCGEYVIQGKSFGTPSGVINLLQALLVTLHGGIDPSTGNSMGLKSDLAKFDTFEKLFDAFKSHIERYTAILAQQEDLEYQIAAQTAPFLFFSLLFDDCIERGKAIFNGGIRYLGGTLEAYGNSNAADSLLAIKKLVYDNKQITLPQLVKILDANFKGYAKQRKMMLDLPKYGNDNSEADAMLVEVDTHLFNSARRQREKTNLHSYLIVVINNHANTVMGRYTAASPDGRQAGKPMNNGNAPASGMDKNGVTAFLNSIVKPPTNIHAGAVQNIKFSSELFNKHRDKLEILLETYWENGGAQAMLTVVNRGDLENAIKHPELYQNLIVRVGGYSARFVDLAPDIQQEILARTLF